MQTAKDQEKKYINTIPGIFNDSNKKMSSEEQSDCKRDHKDSESNEDYSFEEEDPEATPTLNMPQ